MQNFKVVREHIGDKLYKEGDIRRGSEADFKHLIPNVLVPIGVDDGASDEALRMDGPTIEEYVAAGYPADRYPPFGYAARSTPEQIAAFIGSPAKAKVMPAVVEDEPAAEPQPALVPLEEKAEPAPLNKAEEAPANKADNARKGKATASEAN